MKIEIDVSIPESCEFVRYGNPKDGELYMAEGCGSYIFTAATNFTSSRVIVKKKEIAKG